MGCDPSHILQSKVGSPRGSGFAVVKIDHSSESNLLVINKNLFYAMINGHQHNNKGLREIIKASWAVVG